MSVKKVTAAVFAALAVLAVIGAAAVFFAASRDEITNTVITDFPDSSGKVICHETASGNPVEFSVFAAPQKISEEDDGVYRIDVTLNQTESKYYDLENISVEIGFGGDDTVISGYCSGGNSEYFKARINYPEGGQTVCCDFDGNYARIEIAAKLSQPKDLPIKITYDASGKGFNAANKFSGLECEMTVPCNY
ncbi:MAG: hypothetical protein NC253_07075 [Ruminococcus sp.]|nr:hypothetical protein [Ruminococcus sp.]MCM1382467.1 hypothetical protein [Muribaculaceae bacterium]MCM1480276.1 hypothetical protein [Muribaculaceae bacterium]